MWLSFGQLPWKQHGGSAVNVNEYARHGFVPPVAAAAAGLARLDEQVTKGALHGVGVVLECGDDQS